MNAYIVRLSAPLEPRGNWKAQVFIEPEAEDPGDPPDWAPIVGGELEAFKASVLFRNLQSAIETDLDRGSLEDRRVSRDKMAGLEPGQDTANDELALPPDVRTDEDLLPEEDPGD